MKFSPVIAGLILILSFSTVFADNNIEIMVDSIPNIKDRYDVPFGFENDILLQGVTNGFRISATGDLTVSFVPDSATIADHPGNRAVDALGWMFRYDGAMLDTLLAGGIYIPGTYSGISAGALDTMYFVKIDITGTLGQICIDSVNFVPPGGYWIWDNNTVNQNPTFNTDGSSHCIEYFEYTCVDSDGDEFGDPGHPENDCPDDNCPSTFNPDQANSDNDTFGDACDNCPTVDNQDQLNSDTDSHGDLCDNCPAVDNEDQADADSDGIGDACDVCPNDPDNDIDQDGVCGDVDNCPGIANSDQANSDNDSHGDACDNCPTVDNEDQADSDSNGIGDVCDYTCGDANADDIVDVSDGVYVINYAFGGGNPPDPIEAGDVNCDGSVDVSDAVFIINYAFAGGNSPCDTDGDQEPDC
jgi:hypothetical protein